MNALVYAMPVARVCKVVPENSVVATFDVQSRCDIIVLHKSDYNNLFKPQKTFLYQFAVYCYFDTSSFNQTYLERFQALISLKGLKLFLYILLSGLPKHYNFQNDVSYLLHVL